MKDTGNFKKIKNVHEINTEGIDRRGLGFDRWTNTVMPRMVELRSIMESLSRMTIEFSDHHFKGSWKDVVNPMFGRLMKDIDDLSEISYAPVSAFMSLQLKSPIIAKMKNAETIDYDFKESLCSLIIFLKCVKLGIDMEFD